MDKIIVDDVLRSRLHDLRTRFEFCDESGQTLGFFTPAVEVARRESERPVLLPDPLLGSTEVTAPSDLTPAEPGERVKARDGDIRLPDPPVIAEEISAPFDLPRPGPGRRVKARQGGERLPDPPILRDERG